MYVNDSVPLGKGADAYHFWVMVTSVQAQVVNRDQAIRAGFSRRHIAHRLSTGVWQRVYPSVYATFSGRLPREAQLWAAVLWAGEDAMLSHQTAAEVHEVVDKPVGREIHVTVPHRRRPAERKSLPGVVVHRSDQSKADFVGPFKLPRTRIEDTVLDLVVSAPTFYDGYGWVGRAVARKAVTVEALSAALAARRRIRWRAWLTDALEVSPNGTHSGLELRYTRDVERAHGLPKSQHQARRQIDGKVHFKDNLYAKHKVAVEIDGPAYHQNERVQADKDRDNTNLAVDDVKTFRFGPVAVTERACETAAMVAITLKRNGWEGSPRRCRRPGCTLDPVAVSAAAADIGDRRAQPGVPGDPRSQTRQNGTREPR
jgi:very-short-patch-repair endonuclease